VTSAWIGDRPPAFRKSLGLRGLLALMAYALYAQHVLKLEPCPLCILQRVAVIRLGVVFLAAWIHGPARVRGPRLRVLLGFVALAGALFAWRHLWVIAQPPGTVAECGASLDYMLEVLPLHEVLAKVLSGSGECARSTGASSVSVGSVEVRHGCSSVTALGAFGVWTNAREDT
jgi:disulfide bond formation protein DsbB